MTRATSKYNQSKGRIAISKFRPLFIQIHKSINKIKSILITIIDNLQTFVFHKTYTIDIPRTGLPSHWSEILLDKNIRFVSIIHPNSYKKINNLMFELPFIYVIEFANLCNTDIMFKFSAMYYVYKIDH